MAGISRYEKAALGLTAAFLLFTGGWFYARQSAAQPYTVTVSQSAPEVSSAPAASNNEESKPESLLEGEVIDINSAPVEDLQRLPGIGEKRAPGHCGLAGGARPLPVGGRARSGLRHRGKAAGRAAGLCRGGAGGLNARR